MGRLLKRLRRRLRILFRKGDVDAELHEEISAHLEMEETHLQASGLSRNQARREALRRLGGVERTKEWVRDERGGRLLDDVLMDVRYTARALRRHPAFAVIVVGILAVGIGANTAIFSVLNTLLIQPLPYRDADRVVFTLGWDWRDDSMRFAVSAADWIGWQDRTESFEEVAGYRFAPVNLTDIDQPARLHGYRVTPNVFRMLGVQASLGRSFVATDGDLGADNVVILSHALWRDRFGSSPNILERTVMLNDASFRVIGVMPPGFDFPQFNFTGDLWLPMQIDRAALETDRRTSFSMVSVARLQSDVPLAQAQAELDAVYQRLEAQYPTTNTGLGVRVVSMQGLLAEQLVSPIAVLMGTVGMVLLIACANVGCLLLARARVRAREMALRKALGAGRRRLLRQLLTESAVLALIGGGAGVLLSVWGLSLLRASMPDFVTSVIPAAAHIGIDLRVLLFTGGLSLVATVFFGVAPALALSGHSATALRSAVGDAGRSGHRLLSSMVIAEVALSAVLLIGAGLSTRSLLNVLNVDPGFDPTNVTVLDLTLSETRFAEPGRRADLYEQIVDSVGTLPGVESAAVVNTLPFSTSNASIAVSVEGETPVTPGETPRADFRIVSAAYFDAMSIPLVAGRWFNRRDRDGGTPIAVVNETFARRFLADTALGRRLQLGTETAVGPVQVVGVVGDVRHWSLTEPPNPEVYVPLRQNTPPSMTLAVRGEPTLSGLAPSVQRRVRELDSGQPADSLRRMDEVVGQSVLARRVSGGLIAGFGGVALFLAIVGVYGVSSYTTAQRTPELAVRMALGAQSQTVQWLVLSRGVRLAGWGVAVGLIMAAVGARLVESLLYGLSSTDVATFATVGTVVVLASLVACLVPALRASRIDPAQALRSE